MNIAFCHGAFHLGGAERITLDIIQYLSTFGGQYNLFLFAPEFSKQNFPSEVLEKFTWCQTRHKSKDKSADVERLILAHNIDVLVEVVVHLQNITQIKQRTGVKVIYANHGVPFWQKNIIIKHLQSTPVKRLLWNIYGKLWWDILGNAQRAAVRRTRRSYIESDAYMVLCDAYKEQTCQTLGIAPESSHIHVINNSERQVEHPNLHKENIILYCGRLSNHDKGVDRLLRIWKRIEHQLPHWHLQLVGDGPDRDALHALAQELGLKQVSFEGATATPQRYYDQASIVCLTSPEEGWPLAMTEGLAHGCICVSFECSAGVKEILSPHGENGFIVTPFNDEEYANTLLHICNLPQEEQLALRLNAIKRCENYAPAVILEKWRQLFEAVAKQ